MKKRILLCGSYSVIEPLGLLHLGGLVESLGWDRKYHLVKNHDFIDFFQVVKDFKPDIVGFNVYTGNHLQLADALRKLKRERPKIITVVGGPHPTYFPFESLLFADYVVMGEGFDSLRKILEGDIKSSIFVSEKSTQFPKADRVGFYSDYPEHMKSKIKSIITMTGCPYTCTYCYNSSSPKDIKGITSSLSKELTKIAGVSGRLFPRNIRSVDDVVIEGRELAELWSTDILYSQDDVHGFDIKNWIPEFAERWPKEVGIPYHAQMRWEMTSGEGGDRRLDFLKKAGCFGLTLAIEAADPVIRREVLHRNMKQELMFEGMKKLVSRGFKVRTEQITGLPYGATKEETKVNLDADLELVKLNVELREKTGGPTMAWASTFAPYKGTKLGSYCEQYGYYEGDNSDVPDTFFEKSVLSFPKEWIGPSLCRENKEDWLSESKQEEYRERNAELRRIFNLVTLLPSGHVLAERYLRSDEPYSYERLGREIEEHILRLKNRDLLSSLKKAKEVIKGRTIHNGMRRDLKDLASYFAVLPEMDLAIDRVIKYTEKDKASRLIPQIFSDAIRHHLYDHILYTT